MKRILFIMCLALGLSQTSQAQLSFGVKGGVNYNSDSFSEVKDDVLSGAESRTGFHAGVWFRVKIPVVGLYVRPELVYTNLESQVNFNPNGTGIGSDTQTNYSFQKIDIPVLLGKKIFGVGNVFIGPSFQYVLGSDFDASDLESVNSDGFTVGLQLGAGIEFWKLGLDVRWERGFNDIETEFAGTNGNINFDTRVNQIIVGLSYKL